MPVFDLSFLHQGAKKSGGSGVSLLTDQLSILEDTLASDGNLTPGDYDKLIQKARDIQNAPGLTPDQRGNLAVKVSGYQRSKAVSDINHASDIQTMNDSLKAEAAQDIMMVGNNPVQFLTGRVSSLKAKMNDLTDTINQKQMAGADITQYMNEFTSTLSDYNEKMQALTAVTKWQSDAETAKNAPVDPNAPPGQKNINMDPIPGYAAYVKTNQKGEIIDVDYARQGNKTGYNETNGMIGGFQVFGLPNYKQNGKAFFTMGNSLFSGVDSLLPDPTTPGAFKTSKLIDSSMQSGGGGITFGESGNKNFDSGSVPIQSYVPTDSWAKGINGQVYYRRPDGNYTKFINVNSSRDGRPDPKDMLTLPPAFEQNLTQSADQTIDDSAPLGMNQGAPLPPGIPQPLGAPTNAVPSSDNALPGAPAMAPAAPVTQPQSSTAPLQSTQVRRTPQAPTPSAPHSIIDTAKATVSSGVDFLRKALGGG